jgi:signal transduction histidine kinase/HAMP domain-containing protein
LIFQTFDFDVGINSVKLKSLLFVVLLSLATIPTVLFEAVPHSGAFDKEVADVSERHLLIARNISSALERYVRDVKEVFKAVSYNMVAGNRLSDTLALLSGLDFRHICIANASDGKVLYTLNEEVAPCPEKIPPTRFDIFLKLADHGNAHFTPVLPGPHGEPLLYLVLRIKDKIAVGAILTNYVVEIGSSVSFGEKGHAAIVDHTGKVIAHPLPKWRKEMKDISKVLPVQKMLNKETGVATFYSPALKDDMIAGYTWVKGANWGVMIPQPVSELKSRSEESQQHAISGVISGIILAAIFSWVLAGYLTKPVMAVVQSARKLASGDNAARVDISRSLQPAEFVELGKTFNVMADSVDQAYDRLSRIADTVSSVSGEDINSALVREIVSISKADFGFFGELIPGDNSRIRTISFLADGEERANFEYDLENAPCANVVGAKACIYNGDVQQKFPADEVLSEMEINCYIGIPVWTSYQEPIGLIAVMYRKPISNTIVVVDALQIFANRLASEWQQRRIEDNLRIALGQAENASRSKSEFLGNMSHEFRTPLNAIIGFSSVLSGQLYGPIENSTYREYAADIQKSGQHLLTLVGELLDISKIESGEVDIDPSEVEISGAIMECMRMLREKAEESKIRIDVDLPVGLPTLYVDARHFRQILINLITNAIKFTPVSGKVEVSAQVVELSRVEISIKDNGVGIAQENLAKILEPFGQVANSMTRDHDGAGLGLPIVKSLIQLNGGNLGISSVVGEGTIVKISMPTFSVQEMPSSSP